METDNKICNIFKFYLENNFNIIPINTCYVDVEKEDGIVVRYTPITIAIGTRITLNEELMEDYWEEDVEDLIRSQIKYFKGQVGRTLKGYFKGHEGSTLYMRAWLDYSFDKEYKFDGTLEVKLRARMRVGSDNANLMEALKNVEKPEGESVEYTPAG